jgi:hypothetical protein
MSPRSPEGFLNTEFREEGYVHELGHEDIVAISKLEKEAYADNPSLIEGDAKAERQLSKAETRHAEGKPVLSLKFEKDGTLYGYSIAYETRYERGDGLLPLGAPYIYLADFTVRDQKTLSGSRVAILLLAAMLKKYKTLYLDAHNPLPVLAITREHTSRRLLHDTFTLLEKSLGRDFEVSEVNTFESGGNTMYRTLISKRQ